MSILCFSHSSFLYLSFSPSLLVFLSLTLSLSSTLSLLLDLSLFLSLSVSHSLSLFSHPSLLIQSFSVSSIIPTVLSLILPLPSLSLSFTLFALPYLIVVNPCVPHTINLELVLPVKYREKKLSNTKKEKKSANRK